MTPINDNIIDRDVLQDKYIKELIDGMDWKDMMAFVYDTINENLDDYTMNELIEEVNQYDPNLLNDTYTNTNLEAVTDYGVGK